MFMKFFGFIVFFLYRSIYFDKIIENFFRDLVKILVSNIL